MLHYIVLGLCVIVLNILDDVTTYVALHKLPVELRAEEGNPIMAGLMGSDSVLASTIKELGVLLLVTLLIYVKDTSSLYFFVFVLTIVVVSNSFLLVGGVITKKKTGSLINLLETWCKIPKRFSGLAGLLIIWLVAKVLSKVIGG